MDNVLISINPEHVKKIISGEKSIELRRRSIRTSPGERLWIYSTLPVGQIIATATVSEINTDAPKRLWARYSQKIGINRPQFDEYFDGARSGCAIKLEDVHCLESPLSLAYLKSTIDQFHPPSLLNS